ncbi:MAG: DMT family transporter [bacterium]|nr:DMT family transporter [bacterium]
MTPQIKTGIALALTTALISGFSNFLSKISVSVMKDAVLFTTLKNIVVALAFCGIVLMAPFLRKRIRLLTKNEWIKLIAIGAIGGSLPFALFFTGLQQTSALNASLIHKTLFLWVALLAVPFLRERIGWLQGAALAFFAIGNLLVGGFQGFRYNIAEVLIFGATLLWAIEQIIAKKALATLPPMLVAGARMLLGSLILAAYILVRGGGGATLTLTGAQWIWTLIPAALLLGYVLTWYAALSRLPAVATASLLVPASLVTNMLSAVFITHTSPPYAVYVAASYVLAIVATIFALRKTAANVPRPTTA